VTGGFLIHRLGDYPSGFLESTLDKAIFAYYITFITS
jgi:hypothetical protein